MVITKQDLQDWNSHPVTIAIFKEIDSQLLELNSTSTQRSTADETAMATAEKEGINQGIQCIKDAFEYLEDDV